MSFNRWAYVSSNPVNRIDPTGLCEPDENGNCIPVEQASVPPDADPQGLHPTIEPRGITWSPSVNARPVLIKDKNGNIIPSGTHFSQGHITDRNGNYVTGACGVLSIAAVAQWWDPNGLFLKSYDLVWYWDNGHGKQFQ
jgi:hypothetical protein